MREQLLTKVSTTRGDGIRGDTDSEVLFALVLSRLDDGASPSEAISAVADIAELYGGRYNVLFWADDSIVATRWENSLYLRDDDAAVVTSEPLDERAVAGRPRAIDGDPHRGWRSTGGLVSVRIDVLLGRDDIERALRDDVVARAGVHTQGAPAQVVLRRPRL